MTLLPISEIVAPLGYHSYWFVANVDMMPTIHKRIDARALIAALFVLVFVSSACGSDGGDGDGATPDEFQQVMDIGTTFSPDHLDEIGFKKSRSYDLEGLPGAGDAIFGFWRIASGDPIDYEVRFYANHADAVELGTALAEEGSGPDAVLDDDDATYKEGVKDRRMIVGLRDRRWCS